MLWILSWDSWRAGTAKNADFAYKVYAGSLQHGASGLQEEVLLEKVLQQTLKAAE